MTDRIRIRAIDLVDAMTRPPDLDAFLDPRTGEIDLVPTYNFDDDAGAEREESFPVPRIEGTEQYRWMETFAARVAEDDVREALEKALGGRGAFGRFRHELAGYPDLRAAWEAARVEHVLTEARAWLGEIGIAAEIVPMPTPPASPPPPAPQRPRIGLVEMLLLGAPEGKTELLEGAVYRVLLARSPDEARRVFVAVARDLCEMHGLGWRKRFVEGRSDYAIDRFRLRVDDRMVELAVEISPALWRAFGG